jgi:hypothetical protein
MSLLPRNILPGVSLPTLAAVGALAMPACSCRDDGIVPVEDEEVEPFENEFGQWLSMDSLSDGRPAIAYYDSTQGGLGFATGEVAEDGSVEWTHHKVDGYPGSDGLDPGDVGQYASLAVDGESIWIAYYNNSVGGLYYAHCADGSSWETGLADAGGGASPDAGRWASLALDADGNPVIAHYDAGGQELRVSRWNGSSFSSETIDYGDDYEPQDSGESFIEADVGRYARLLIDGDTEYLAYYDAANGDLKLATNTGGGWSVDVVDEDGDVGAWPSLLADGGDLWIAYHDVGNQDLKLATGPGSWKFETVDDGEHVGADSELFLKNGNPAVIYFDGQDNDMRYSEYTGSAWMTPSSLATEGAMGFHNETVEGTGGVRYVACFDYTNKTLWFSLLDG